MAVSWKSVILRKNVSNMKYPIGIQTFEQIIEEDYSYVDKTTLVYQLAHYAKNQFLSRPRGFGKSLLVYTIFAMLGADVSPELPTSDGRIDLVLKTVDCIFIFELKYGKDAVTAINQIEEKKYFFAFADDKRKKFLVGINFSDDSRTIDDWTVIGG